MKIDAFNIMASMIDAFDTYGDAKRKLLALLDLFLDPAKGFCSKGAIFVTVDNDHTYNPLAFRGLNVTHELCERLELHLSCNYNTTAPVFCDVNPAPYDRTRAEKILAGNYLPVPFFNRKISGMFVLWPDENPQTLQSMARALSRQINLLLSSYFDSERLSELYQIVDRNPLSILILNQSGNFDYANYKFYEITGFSPAEVIGKHYSMLGFESRDFTTADDLVNQIETMSQARTEVRYHRRDGLLYWAMINIIPLRDHQGVTRNYLLVKEDISDIKQAEQALRESETKFRTIVQNINEYIYMTEYLNEQSASTYHSPRCEEMTGYSADEFISNEFLWYSMIYTEDRQKVKEFIENTRRPGAARSYIEHRIVRKDGQIRWVSNSCTVDGHPEEGHYRVIGFIQDITARRNTIDQLRKLSRAVEQSPASVVITNTDGDIEYVNPKFTSVTGYTYQEVIGRNPRLLKSNARSREEYHQLWETISHGEEWRGEFLNVKKNGEHYWEFASISPIRDSKGFITHYLAVKEDITERKKAEEALRVSEEKLRERNEIIESDLKNAQHIQKALLPQEAPESPFIRTDYRFLSLEAVGGDYFAFYPNENYFGAFIGDVSGHGVSAALFLSLLKYTTDDVAKRFTLQPDLLLKSLNTVLCRTMSSYFITAMYAVFERKPQQKKISLSFANGGHPPAVYYNANKNEFLLIRANGTILGMFENLTYERSSVLLSPGDRIFMYTDGVPETRCESGDIVGFEQILELFKRGHDRDLSKTLDNIITELNIFRGPIPIEDDIVIIGFEII